MIKNLRIEDDYLKFKGEKGYYTVDLGAIDMFGMYFSQKMQIIASNGRKLVEIVEDEEYIQVRDLLLSDPRFLMIDHNAVINLDNLKRWSVSHSHLDYYDLELQFIQSLGVVGSKEECEHMKELIENAMKSRIEEYQESTTKHDTSVESNL